MIDSNPMFSGPPPESNRFMLGYDAAYEEINTVIQQGEVHERECVDCPACEVIRAVRREIVRRMTGPEGHQELLLLLNLSDEFYNERGRGG